MIFEKKKTNMELEITEQISIIPQILAKYINPENEEIKLDLLQNIKKIVNSYVQRMYHCIK